jgi:hypothetical protein
MNQSDVLAAIRREQDHARRKWGDKPRTVTQWLLIIEEEVREAKMGYVKHESDREAIRELLQVAACCLSALEEHGIVERTDP